MPSKKADTAPLEASTTATTAKKARNGHKTKAAFARRTKRILRVYTKSDVRKMGLSMGLELNPGAVKAILSLAENVKQHLLHSVNFLNPPPFRKRVHKYLHDDETGKSIRSSTGFPVVDKSAKTSFRFQVRRKLKACDVDAGAEHMYLSKVGLSDDTAWLHERLQHNISKALQNYEASKASDNSELASAIKEAKAKAPKVKKAPKASVAAEGITA